MPGGYTCTRVHGPGSRLEKPACCRKTHHVPQTSQVAPSLPKVQPVLLFLNGLKIKTDKCILTHSIPFKHVSCQLPKCSRIPPTTQVRTNPPTGQAPCGQASQTTFGKAAQLRQSQRARVPERRAAQGQTAAPLACRATGKEDEGLWGHG